MKGIEVAYALGRERGISGELEEQRRRLQIEIGMLKDPGRVVGLARDKLKMGPPAAGDIVRAGPGVLPALAAKPAAPAGAPGAGEPRPPTTTPPAPQPAGPPPGARRPPAPA